VCRPAGHTMDLTSASPTAHRRAKVKFNGKPEAAARYGACWCSGKLRHAPVVGESDGLLVLLSFRTKKLLPPTTLVFVVEINACCYCIIL
jgi:hypothetical protein